MILRKFFTRDAEPAFLQKYAGMPHEIRSRCAARHAQEFSKTNSSRDIAIYPRTNRPKSQNASPLFRIIITFLYTVVIIWVSIGENSRNIRAQKRKISISSRRRSPRPSHAKRRKACCKKTFHFRLRLQIIGKPTPRAEHYLRCSLVICARLPYEIDASREEPVAVVQGRRRRFTDFFYSDPGYLARLSALSDYVNLGRHGSRLPDMAKRNTG